jgi:hypothetical protein
MSSEQQALSREQKAVQIMMLGFTLQGLERRVVFCSLLRIAHCSLLTS